VPLRSHGQIPAHRFPATGTSGEVISDGQRDTFLVCAVTPVDARCGTGGVSPGVGVTLRHGASPFLTSRKRGTPDRQARHLKWQHLPQIQTAENLRCRSSPDVSDTTCRPVFPAHLSDIVRLSGRLVSSPHLANTGETGRRLERGWQLGRTLCLLGPIVRRETCQEIHKGITFGPIRLENYGDRGGVEHRHSVPHALLQIRRTGTVQCFVSAPEIMLERG
jgi:hypothetical protein